MVLGSTSAATLLFRPRGHRYASGSKPAAMTTAVGLTLSLLLALLYMPGCATTQTAVPVIVAAEPVSVAVAMVRDELVSRSTSPVPATLQEAVMKDLKRRNIRPRLVGESGYDEALALIPTSPGRLAALARQADGAQLILLVETRATFYSQLSGRYRWTVDTRVTLAPTADLARASSLQVQDPAFLFYDHQREDEAISEVAERIARQVGVLADDALVARWPGLPDTTISDGSISRPHGKALSSADGKTSLYDWAPLPAPSGDSIYFAMVDRFARPGRVGGAEDLADPHAFYGGTIEGLRQRLDWLEELGVGTLWISPVYLSREKEFHGWGAFHGYWVEDHMSPWPRLGGFEDLRGLSEDLRSRDMRLLLDVVVNHVGYDAPLLEARPDWFNQLGSIEDWSCPDQLVPGEVHGLPDLDQKNPEVYDYLLAHAKLWIDEVRPDGFRLDAVKHVPLSFWRRFNSDVRAYAGESFFLLGEDLEGDPEKLAHTLHEGDFDALFDFPLYFALVDVFCRDAPVGRLASVLSMDHLYGEGAGDSLVTLLDNHDLPRILSACDGDIERVKNAITALTALRGTPSLTWGTDTGLSGKDEPENRAPMRFDDSHPLHAHVSWALALRKDHPRLVGASTLLEKVEEEVLVLLRRDGSAPFMLVVNLADAPYRVNLESTSISKVRSLKNGDSTDDEEILVGPRSAEVFRVDIESDRGVEKHLDWLEETHGTTTRPGPERMVVFTASEPALPEAELVLVGAGEALGRWDLSSAPRFEGGSATLSLPAGLVAEYKLALVDNAGARWEEGPNRYLLIKPGDEPLEIDLQWREG